MLVAAIAQWMRLESSPRGRLDVVSLPSLARQRRLVSRPGRTDRTDKTVRTRRPDGRLATRNGDWSPRRDGQSGAAAAEVLLGRAGGSVHGGSGVPRRGRSELKGPLGRRGGSDGRAVPRGGRRGGWRAARVQHRPADTVRRAPMHPCAATTHGTNGTVRAQSASGHAYTDRLLRENRRKRKTPLDQHR